MFKRILVPTDGSELSAKAVTLAISLARTHSASLVALHVFPHLPGAHHGAAAPFLKQLEGEYEKHQREEAQRRADQADVEQRLRILDAVAKEAAAAGVAAQVVIVESDEIYSQIIDVGKQEGCDLVCMASHGRRGISAVVLGGETHKVLTHSHIPVLVVR